MQPSRVLRCVNGLVTRGSGLTSRCAAAPALAAAVRRAPTTSHFHTGPATMADAPEPAPASSAPRKYRVYTRTGDKGTSSLYNGQRRPKDDAFFEALGGVDELNSAIGLAREYCALASVGVEEQLVEIQSRLIDVGSTIATPRGSSSEEQVARVAFSPVHAEDLEKWIDAMDDELPALKNFILPGGGLASAHLHHARTVCRRAERLLVALVRDGEVGPEVGVFVNRLSDYLFVTARYAAMKSHAVEQIYAKARGLKERHLSTTSASTAATAAGAGGSGAAPVR